MRGGLSFFTQPHAAHDLRLRRPRKLGTSVHEHPFRSDAPVHGFRGCGGGLPLLQNFLPAEQFPNVCRPRRGTVRIRGGL